MKSLHRHRPRRTPELAYYGALVGFMFLASLAIVSSGDSLIAAQVPGSAERVAVEPGGAGGRAAADTDAAAVQTLTPEERAAALERRAGERGAFGPRGESIVLGMHIQEGKNHQPRVVDVTAASPAFDAGVREGDEIVSFDGFQGETYREWIDGIRRLVTDTPAGELMAVQLRRNGRAVAAKIQAPESGIGEAGLLGLPAQPLAQAGGQQAGSALPGASGQAAMPGAGNNVFVNNAPFNNLFNQQGLGGVPDRAVAQIVRLDGPQQSTSGVLPSGSNGGATASTQRQQSPLPSGQDIATGQAANQPAGSTGVGIANQIGIAGFRDAQNGLLVMLDVGGLAPGSYRVSIEDPGLVFGGQAAGAGVNPAGSQPASVPGGAELNRRSSGATPPAAAPNGQTASPVTRSTAAGGPGQTPTTETASQPAGATLSQSTSALSTTALPGTAGQGTTPTNPAGTLSEIGTLTIDQSGTGRLQQIVEGVQVRNAVGQAIAIYAEMAPQQTAIPANPNESGIRSAGQGVARPSTDPNVPSRPPALAQNGAQPPTNNMSVPTAAGMIQLLSDRRPISTTSGVPASPVTPQPASPPGTQPTESEAGQPAGPLSR